MVSFNVDEWILLIAFFIIYGAFLAYDLFKRGEKYGSLAYITALLPANYLWYISTRTMTAENLEFGVMGSMMVLAILWIACVVRDVIIKNKAKGFKDADDIALILIIGIVLQFILQAVLPAIPDGTGAYPMKEGTNVFLSFFFVPDFAGTSTFPPAAIYLNLYRVFSTVLTISIIVPVVLDLRGEKVSLLAIIIITALFALPFSFLAFLWVSFAAMGALLFLICVLFFLLLLALTKGNIK